MPPRSAQTRAEDRHGTLGRKTVVRPEPFMSLVNMTTRPPEETWPQGVAV